jgi:hypothetical protein
MARRLCLIAWFVVLFFSSSTPAIPQTGFGLPVVRLPGEHPQGLAGPFGLVSLPAQTSAWANGQAETLVGVYAPGAFAHPVLAQPPGRNLFVSVDPEVLTQFQLPARTETTGLLAHNYLAGAHFFRLQVGSAVFLVYGDGKTAAYQVRELADYRTLDPYRYRELETGLGYSDVSLFEKIYVSEEDRLVLQTCIEQDGNLSWGVRFVIATRMPDGPLRASLRSLPERQD